MGLGVIGGVRNHSVTALKLPGKPFGFIVGLEAGSERKKGEVNIFSGLNPGDFSNESLMFQADT